MSIGHLRITTLSGEVIYEGEGTLHLEGRGPLGGLPPEAVVQPLQVEVARPDGMHFAADLTTILPCVQHEIRVDFPTVSAPLAVPDGPEGWGIDVLTDIPGPVRPDYTLTLDLDDSNAGWLRDTLTLTPDERASVRQAQAAVREAVASRRTFRERMLAPRQPRGLDSLTMQQVMDLHRLLAPYGENVTLETLRGLAVQRPDLADAICDAFDVPATLLLGAVESQLRFEDDPPQWVEPSRYDDLIDSTRLEFVPDPHNYTTPRTNAMSWSPPADGEKVPRCP